MLADKPTELSRIKLENLNSTARPYDQRAFIPLDPTVNWLSHLALAIYIFVDVNLDALTYTYNYDIFWYTQLGANLPFTYGYKQYGVMVLQA